MFVWILENNSGSGSGVGDVHPIRDLSEFTHGKPPDNGIIVYIVVDG